MSQLILNLSLLLWVCSTWAATPQSKLQLPNLLPKLKDSKVQASLGVENSQYLGANQQYFRDDASENETSFSLKFRGEARFARGSAILDFQDDYRAEERWNYFKPKEIYYLHSSENVTHTMGRKLKNWSQWEEQWRQGVFQPRYMDNKLTPMSVGLTGYFLDFSMQSWNSTLGLLPVSIPDIGPHQSVQNERFVSKNPWFNPPPRQYFLGEGLGDIHYSVTYPNISDVVLKPGLIFKTEKEISKTHVRFAAAYKPMPQLLLAFPSYDQVVVTDGMDFMRVEIEPRVIYHQVVSTDVSRQVGSWQAMGSLMLETPDADSTPTEWTAQKVQQAFVVSGEVSRTLGVEGPRAPSVNFGFMKLWGGDAKDRGFFAGKETLFERRYQFLEAVKVGLKRDFGLFKSKVLEAKAYAIYDFQQNGGILSLANSMFLSKNFRVDLALEFLGLVNENGQVRDGFLYTYRSNDRLALGINYVF